MWRASNVSPQLLNPSIDNPKTLPLPKPARRPLLRVVTRILVAIVVTVLFGRVLQYSVKLSQHEGKVPGFAAGMAHGALMPCGFPMLLVGQDLPIYAERNSGRTYKLGYTLGVNLCGALFFGSVYWRLGRLRKLTRDMRQSGRNEQRGTAGDP